MEVDILIYLDQPNFQKFLNIYLWTLFLHVPLYKISFYLDHDIRVFL